MEKGFDLDKLLLELNWQPIPNNFDWDNSHTGFDCESIVVDYSSIWKSLEGQDYTTEDLTAPDRCEQTSVAVPEMDCGQDGPHPSASTSTQPPPPTPDMELSFEVFKLLEEFDWQSIPVDFGSVLKWLESDEVTTEANGQAAVHDREQRSIRQGDAPDRCEQTSVAAPQSLPPAPTLDVFPAQPDTHPEPQYTGFVPQDASGTSGTSGTSVTSVFGAVQYNSPLPSGSLCSHPGVYNQERAQFLNLGGIFLRPIGELNGQTVYEPVRVVPTSGRPCAKRPMNAFMLFRKEQHRDMSAKLGVKNASQVNIALGEIWRSMSNEEKEKYFKQAHQERLRYNQENPDYIGSLDNNFKQQ